MAALVVLFASAAALCAGYYLGRRSVGPAPRRTTWRKRTSRVALGRRAASLLVLIAVRRAQDRWRYAIR